MSADQQVYVYDQAADGSWEKLGWTTAAQAAGDIALGASQMGSAGRWILFWVPNPNPSMIQGMPRVSFGPMVATSGRARDGRGGYYIDGQGNVRRQVTVIP